MNLQNICFHILWLLSFHISQSQGENVCLNQTTVPIKFLDYQDNSPNKSGVVLDYILNSLVPIKCCNRTSFKFLSQTGKVRSTTEWQEMMENDNEKDNLTLYFPAFVSKGEDIAFDEYPFQLIFRSPGMAVVSPTVQTNRSDQIIDALVSCWQFLLMTILLALVAGFIAWACEFHYNVDQFPSSFFNGSWQGFWWAMVTMTTVGYGDKAPVTVPGRIFTIIWMLTSSVIVSILTAHITSSLTADDIDTGFGQNYVGAQMAILVGRKYYFENGFNIGADYEEMISTEEAFAAMKNESVKRYLSDNYLTLVSSRFPNMKIETVYQQPLDVGVAIVGGRSQCPETLNKYLSCLGKVARRYIIKMRAVNKIKPELSDGDSTEYFNTEPMKTTLRVLGGIIGVIFLCGGIWEIMNTTKNKKNLRTHSGHDLELAQDQRFHDNLAAR